MKKVVEKEVEFCDFCGKENYLYECQKCGKGACYECRSKVGVEYAHAVYFSGIGDGFYCRPCDIELSESGTDAKYNAFVVIRSLRDEMEGWSKAFEKRRDKAEEDLRKLP